jgi:hypothetical protein
VSSSPRLPTSLLIFTLVASVSILMAFVALRNLELGDVPMCVVVGATYIHSKPDDSVCYCYIIDEDDQ